MKLWIEWFRCIHLLRNSCSRYITFCWMALVISALAIRPDGLGVTSFVRAAFLDPVCYYSLLHFFHSKALPLQKLLNVWVKLALKLFSPVTVDGYVVFAADGLKVPREGKKMPAVKCLHQESGNNSKSTFIMGHSFQALSLLVSAPQGLVAAVPLASRIHEGVVWTNRDARTLLDKMAES